MEILYLTNLPSPYAIDFYNELGKIHDLTVVFERTNARNRVDSWFNFDSSFFKAIYLNGINIGVENSLCFGIKKILKKVKKNTIVIISNYSSPTAMIAIRYLRRRKIPFMIHADGCRISSENRLKFKIKHYFLSSAKAYLSPGVLTDEYFRYYGNDSSKIYRYPFTSLKNSNLIDTVLSNEDKKNLRKQSFMDYENVVLFVGRPTEAKGIDVLIKTAALVDKSISFHIIGGNIDEYTSKLIEENNVENVFFHGIVPSNDIFEYMKLADLFFLPTKKDAWGLVINEAMSQGISIMTSLQCVAGCELIVTDENGYLYDCEDYKSYANKINFLFCNKDKLYRMGLNNLEKIKKYTIEEMVQSYLKAILDFSNNYLE